MSMASTSQNLAFSTSHAAFPISSFLDLHGYQNRRATSLFLFRQASTTVLCAQRGCEVFGMQSLSLSLRPSAPLRRARPVTILMMSLPTAVPETTIDKPQAKWSARAIKAFSMAELEARKLKYPTTGTEALLMGILTEGTSQAARFLRSNGITLFDVRDQTVAVLGKADMYFFSPEHPPLTEPAQKALDWAVAEKQKLGDNGEISATLLLLGIWAQKGSAGHQVLTSLGFDENKADELAELVDSYITWQELHRYQKAAMSDLY